MSLYIGSPQGVCASAPPDYHLVCHHNSAQPALFVLLQAMCSGCISPHHCAYQTCHTHRSLTLTWLCTFQTYASAAYRAVLDARALSQLATDRGIGCDPAQASGAAVK